MKIESSSPNRNIDDLISDAYAAFSELDLEQPQKDQALCKSLELNVTDDYGKPLEKIVLNIGSYGGYLSVHTQVEDLSSQQRFMNNFYEMIVRSESRYQLQTAPDELKDVVIEGMFDAIRKSITFTASLDLDEAVKTIVRKSKVKVLTEPGPPPGYTVQSEHDILDFAAALTLSKRTGQKIMPDGYYTNLEDTALLIQAEKVFILKAA